jgi:carbon starvation protein CstA
MFIGIVVAMQVPQAPSASKSQTKTVLDVGSFHLAPSMTIVLACGPCFTFVENG